MMEETLSASLTMDEEDIFPAAASHENGGSTTPIMASTETFSTNSLSEHSHLDKVPSVDSIAEKKHGSPFTKISSRTASDNTDFSEATSVLLTEPFECQATVSRALLKIFEWPPAVSQSERKQSVSPSLLTNSLVCPPDVSQSERKQSVSPSLLINSSICPPDVLQAKREQSVSPPNSIRSSFAESFQENQSQFIFPSEVKYTPSSREDPSEILAESPSPKPRSLPPTSLHVGCLSSVSTVENDNESIPIAPAALSKSSHRISEEESKTSKGSPNESFTFSSPSLDIDSLFEMSILEEDLNESVPVTSTPSCVTSRLIYQGCETSEATPPSTSKSLLCASTADALETEELLDYGTTASQENRNTISGSSNTLVSTRTYISHTRNEEILSGNVRSVESIAEKKYGSPFSKISSHIVSDNAGFSEAPSTLLTESFEFQPTIKSFECSPGVSQSESKQSLTLSLLTSLSECPPDISPAERKKSVSSSLLTSLSECPPDISPAERKKSVSPSLLTSLSECPPHISPAERKQSVSPSLLTSSLECPPDVSEEERKQSVPPPNPLHSPCAEFIQENKNQSTFPSEGESTPSSREDPSEVIVESPSPKPRSFPPTSLDAGCLPSVGTVENDHESITITPAVLSKSSHRISEEESVSSEPPPNESFTFSSHSLDMDNLFEMSILEDEDESVPVTSASSCVTARLFCRGHESSEVTRPSTSEPLVCASVTGASGSEELLDYGSTDSEGNRNTTSGSSNTLVYKSINISPTRNNKKILLSGRKPYLIPLQKKKLKYKRRTVSLSAEEDDLPLHKKRNLLSSLGKRKKDESAGFSDSEESKWTLNPKECGPAVHKVKRHQSGLPKSRDYTEQHLYSSSKEDTLFYYSNRKGSVLSSKPQECEKQYLPSLSESSKEVSSSQKDLKLTLESKTSSSIAGVSHPSLEQSRWLDNTKNCERNAHSLLPSEEASPCYGSQSLPILESSELKNSKALSSKILGSETMKRKPLRSKLQDLETMPRKPLFSELRSPDTLKRRPLSSERRTSQGMKRKITSSELPTPERMKRQLVSSEGSLNRDDLSPLISIKKLIGSFFGSFSRPTSVHPELLPTREPASRLPFCAPDVIQENEGSSISSRSPTSANSSLTPTTVTSKWSWCSLL